MDDILIDRMVLDIPGLTPDQAEDVALRVGKGLAESKARPGTFSNLSVTLDPAATGAETPRLANLILAALLRQIG
jgi:hypothetical protein